LLVGREAQRAGPCQAAWLYAQMVRWGQATYSPDALEIAQKVFRPDLYDAAIGSSAVPARHVPDGVGAFDGARLIRTTLPGISRPSPSSGAALSSDSRHSGLPIYCATRNI
jgi:hypothetical protein